MHIRVSIPEFGDLTGWAVCRQNLEIIVSLRLGWSLIIDNPFDLHVCLHQAQVGFGLSSFSVWLGQKHVTWGELIHTEWAASSLALYVGTHIIHSFEFCFLQCSVKSFTKKQWAHRRTEKNDIEQADPFLYYKLRHVHVSMCSCVNTAVWKSPQEQAEDKKILESAWWGFLESPEEDSRSPAQARPKRWRRDERVMMGVEGATWAPKEESSSFSQFSIFNEVGDRCINPGSVREETGKDTDKKLENMIEERWSLIHRKWRKCGEWSWEEKNEGQWRERMQIEM